MSENTKSNNNDKNINGTLEKYLPQIKKFSWSPFAVILLCFFLPFVEVSCQGQEIASLTGMQMTFGTEINNPGSYGESNVQEVEGSLLLILIFFITIGCIVLSFIKYEFNHLIIAIGSGLSFLFLLFIKWSIDDEVLKQSGPLLKI